jgi:hypothetical protein
MTTREWFAVYARLIRLPKFRDLTDAAQLALLYVWALAGDETPEATWRSADTLDALLRLNGRPAGTVPELVAAGWIDTQDDGTVTAHDWDEWQFAASKDARNAWEARYMRDWRRAKKDAGPAPSLPAPSLPVTETATQQDSTGQQSATRRQRVNNNGTTPTVDDPLRKANDDAERAAEKAASDAFTRATGILPNPARASEPEKAAAILAGIRAQLAPKGATA